MRKTIVSYIYGQCGFNEACRNLNIPKNTLKRHLDCLNVKANNCVKSFRPLTLLPELVEQQLVSHILKLEEYFRVKHN